jgi:hypothetical protein
MIIKDSGTSLYTHYTILFIIILEHMLLSTWKNYISCNVVLDLQEGFQKKTLPSEGRIAT